MENHFNITACLTMGRRPDLLRQTLSSLGDLLPSLKILAVNDFGDAATNEVFSEICPNGQRIDLGRQVGHHNAVDAMYAQVRTPYIFHFEDDWQFHRTDFLSDAVALLNADARLSSVCLRDVADMPGIPEGQGDDVVATEELPAYQRLDALHDQWHGFTFNPHLAKRELWTRTGPFSTFKKERHISRTLRAQGHFVTYLDPGACSHIGEEQSVAVPKQPISRRFKRWVRAGITANHAANKL